MTEYEMNPTLENLHTLIETLSIKGFAIIKIAEYLNLCKIPTITRSPIWGYGSVRKILQSQFVKGVI